MKVNQLKQLIKEAVREAIQEEFANARTQPVEAPKSSVKEQPQSTLEEVKTFSNPIDQMLHETRNNMNREDYKNVLNMNTSNINAPAMASPAGPQPGLDLSQLDFTKKAGAIYKRSNELQK